MPLLEKQLRQRRKIGRHGSERSRQRSDIPKRQHCGRHEDDKRQELGTNSRVGRMFPMDNLRLPLVAPISVAATAAISSIPSFALWHARLGHASSSQV